MAHPPGAPQRDGGGARWGSGRPGGPSLPVRKPDVWPIFRGTHQPGTHGIVQDIFDLVAEALVAAQPMLEEIPLPRDAKLLGCPGFPFGNDRFHRFARCGKRQEGVRVIRHQQKHMCVPHLMLIAEGHRLKHPSGHCFARELILTARLAANGDEINRIIRASPRRNVMRQLVAARQRHVPEGVQTDALNKALVGRTRRVRRGGVAVARCQWADGPAGRPYQG